MLSEVFLDEETEALIKNNIILTIGNLEEKEKIANFAKKYNTKAKIHVKIDTGFGRYGFLYTEKDNILKAVENTDFVQVQGVYTHFSKPIKEKWTKIQFERFKSLFEDIRKINSDVIFHCSASTAFLLYPEMNCDCIRIRFMYSRKSYGKFFRTKKDRKFSV